MAKEKERADRFHPTAALAAATDYPGVVEHRGSIRIPWNLYGVLGWSLGGPGPDTGVEAWLTSSPTLKPRVCQRIIGPQKEALVALCSGKRYLYAPRGSGKTLVGLLWLLRSVGVRLFVCPARARLQVAEEIALWTNAKPVILKSRTTVIPPEAMVGDTILITAWETLSDWTDELVALAQHGRGRSLRIVFDEAHTAKSPDRGTMRVTEDGEKIWEDKDNLTANASKLAQAADAVVAMSGSPVPNRRIDLWAQLDLIERWLWGGKRAFGIRYCDGTHNGYGYEYKGKSNDAEFRKRLLTVMHVVPQSAVRSLYPQKRRGVIRLERDDLTPAPAGIRAEIRAAAKAAKGKTEALVGAYFEKLLEETASQKRGWIVKQVIEDIRCGQKVTVFTGRRQDADALGQEIEAKLAKLRLDDRKRLWYSHGGVSNEARNSIRLEYMAYDPMQSVRAGTADSPVGCVNVGTGQAWGESLNLHDTDVVYFVMLPPTPKDVQQWEDRFCRMGGTRPVLINYVVVPGTIEDKLVDMLAFDKMPQVIDTVEDEQMTEWLDEFRRENPTDMLAGIEAALAVAAGKVNK